MIGSFARTLFGTANDRKIKPLMKRAAQIGELEPKYQAMSDHELRGQTEILKGRLAAGESLDAILNDAFAVVREGAKRSLGQRHYDVQLVGGMILNSSKIAEMKTGEGKTLVATLAVYLNALNGKGVHVVTVNDYLAKRDAEWMGQVYRFLGLTVGVILHGLTDEERRAAYACDVTYATNNELGFDYLRDNMKYSLESMVQRGHAFAIVDEVDSILIDEARTPLIISGPTEDQSELYKALDEFIPKLTDEHFELDEKARQVHLTEDGNEFIEDLLKEAGMLQGESLYDVENVTIVHHVTQALRAHKLFQRDKDYIVKGDKVVIIDEFTGRMMEGRRYSEGLHQALEAKEKVKIQPENVTLASITFQNYFRLYDKLAGMTGTALTEASEFLDIYKLDVMEVPTNVSVQRIDYDDEVYRTIEEKYGAIATLIAGAHVRGQPVLVGTTSIEKSEQLSALLSNAKYLKALGERIKPQAEEALANAEEGMAKAEAVKDEKRREATLAKAEAALKEARNFKAQADFLLGAKDKTGIPHAVLNARYHEQEAQIVAQAGRLGGVTIATNMAGRGTDIQLGGNLEMRIITELGPDATRETHALDIDRIAAEIKDEKKRVLEAGGLYVVGTERHESRRIDNQLRGRSGRQGDPGASKFYVSIQDDLMRIFGSDRMDGMLKTLGLQEGEAITHPWLSKALEKAQQKVEARNFDIRKNVLKYDDVQNDQRKVIFEQRKEIMDASDLSETITDMRHEVAEELVGRHIPERAYAEQWDTEGLEEEIAVIFGMKLPVSDWAKEEGIANEEIRARIIEKIDSKAAERAVQVGPDVMRRVEKGVLLQTIDGDWREHIIQLDHLRQMVGLRGYAQRDPLNEFKTEAFALFENLLQRLRLEVTQTLMNIQIEVRAQEEPIEQRPLPEMEAHHIDPLTGRDELADVPPQIPSVPSPRRNAPQAAPNPKDPSSWGKVPRNSPCPCGSGKKFKHCHGAVVASV